MFNPAQFMNTQYEESNATEVTPVPEGETRAVSEPVDDSCFREVTIQKGENAGKKMVWLDIKWRIDDPALGEQFQRRIVRQSMSLDVREDGTLAFGPDMNVGLGRLRKALNQNDTGKPWSFAALGHQMAVIKVKHRIDTEANKIYVEVADVKSV